MTPESIEKVQSTWKTVAPAAEQVAELFYGRLFELEPRYRELFKGDMKSQGRKLTAMLNTAVNSLGRLETILPAVSALGQRHVEYGVRADDYAVVGQALLWTLEQGLGDAFTADVKDAWVETYGALSGAMIHAAEEVAAEAPK